MNAENVSSRGVVVVATKKLLLNERHALNNSSHSTVQLYKLLSRSSIELGD